MKKLKQELNANTVGSGPMSVQQKGITLIALIITIIVMLILVGVTINVALNGGLFTKAEDAAMKTEKQAIYEQIVSNMELTNDGKISVKGTFDKVIAEFGADKVTNINPETVDESTTEVTFSIIGKTGTYDYKITDYEIKLAKKMNLNEFGFYFNEEYICKDWNTAEPNDYAMSTYFEDGTIEIVAYEEYGWKEGRNLSLVGLAGETYTTIESLEYNKKYSGIGIFNSQCSGIVDNNGNLITTIVFDKENTSYMNRKVIIGETIEGNFSEDGKTLIFNDKAFIIEE